MKKIITILAILTQILAYGQENTILKTHSDKELRSDFDLMVNSLKEAHAGLFWYQSMSKFDSICANEKAKIKNGMNSYDFFRIASKIVTATKEGHCRIGSSRDISKYFDTKALIPPIIVKALNGKLYILNNIKNKHTKGKVLTKINNTPIDNIVEEIFTYSTKYADGFIKTGKLRYSIDYTGLAFHYTDYFDNKSIYELELLDTKTNKKKKIKVRGVSFNEFRLIEKEVKYPSKFTNPIELKIDKNNKIAQLAIHSFRHTYYDKKGNEEVAFRNFSSKIDSVFKSIYTNKITDLIIDIRQNSGGTEGYEDYVFSYLTDKKYSKYKYVQASALTFSFLKHTQYNNAEKKKSFEKDMQDEFYLEKDGRYLRKATFMEVTPPQKHSFKGNIYVLISGKTYSGGAEFAGLVKDKTKAIFIGEETAGGFYGQTSGFGLTLTLPNTKMRIRIPLLKFATNFSSADIPFGRGVIPNYKLQPTYEQYVNGIDSEMNFVLNLIKKTNENKQVMSKKK